MHVKFMTEVRGEKFAFQTEGNERGLQTAEAKQTDNETWASSQLTAQLDVTSEEFRLMYFALKTQVDVYVRQLGKTESDDWEELMFLHGEVAKLSKLLFDLELNYDMPTRRLAKAFLNI